VAAPVLRNVDLDAVPEPEEPLRARPIPDQRIERAQQRAASDPQGSAGGAVQVGGGSPASDHHRFQLTCLYQLSNRLPAALEAQPVVITQVCLGGHTQRGAGTGDHFPGAFLGADPAAEYLGG
jgi:hypothetical protein